MKKRIIIISIICLACIGIFLSIFLLTRKKEENVVMPEILFEYQGECFNGFLIYADGSVYKTTRKTYEYNKSLPSNERMKRLQEDDYKDMLKFAGKTNPKKVQRMYKLFTKVVLKEGYTVERVNHRIADPKYDAEFWYGYCLEGETLCRKKIYNTEYNDIKCSDRRAYRIVRWLKRVKGEFECLGEIDSEVELRPFEFQSAEDVENLSDEDFIYIVKHGYKSTDFIHDIDGNSTASINLFGIPLEEWEGNGKIRTEKIEKNTPRMRYKKGEINLDERISVDVLKKFALRECYRYIETRNSFDEEEGIGTKIEDGEVIFCGENDDYLEYGIRYTENRYYYDEGFIVNKKEHAAQRWIFDKNRVDVEKDNRIKTVYLGEYTLDKMKADFDSELLDGMTVFYREFSETEKEIICEYYTTRYMATDMGMDDIVILVKVKEAYNKKSHITSVYMYDLKAMYWEGEYAASI